ncbi:MAG: tetratricopeptide repeat protein [Ktedonobacterales bacterium]
MDGQSSQPGGDMADDLSADESADSWFKRGATLFNQQLFREAVPFFDRALTLDGHLTSAWALRGASRFGLSEYAAALPDVEYALALAKGAKPLGMAVFTRLLQLHAETLFRLGQYTKALGSFAELQRLGSLTAYKWTLLGDTYRALKHPKDAVAAYHQALTHPERDRLIDSITGAAWVSVAQVFLEQNDNVDALEASQLALRADPELVRGWGLQSQALRSLHRPAEALTAAQHALDLNPPYVYGWVMKAKALQMLKRYDDARDAYQQAQRLLQPQTREWNGVLRDVLLMLLLAGRWGDAWQELATAALAQYRARTEDRSNR